MSSTNIEFKAIPGQFNIDEAQGMVECFVAGIGNKDSVGDVLVPGAFTESLKRRKPRVVWGHNWNDPIGKVLEIYEVGPGDARLPAKMKNAGIGGLYAKVQFNLNSEKGREAFANIAFFGQEQEWSIGYKTLDSIHDPSIQANILKEVELYEVSPVLHGANQLTGTISVKSDETAEKCGPGMMGMPYARQTPMVKPQVIVVRQDDDDDEDESQKPIFSEGLAQSVSEDKKNRIAAELQSRSGSPIKVVKATENMVVFKRMTSDGRSTMYRISYHTPDNYNTFMFGKPELANGMGSGSRVVVPSQMPSMPMQVKPQANAYMGEDEQTNNFGTILPKEDSYEKTAFDIELSQIEESISENFDIKAGRVLNSRNLSKLKNVMESLQEIIAASEKEIDTKSELFIPVNIENAFHTKELLDPIFDYHRVESKVTEEGIVITSSVSEDFVEAIDTAVKALGGKIGGGIKKGRGAARSAAQAFDPNAWDGDGDGLVQEGTPFQRPAIPGVNDRASRSLRSTGKSTPKNNDGFDSVDELRKYAETTLAEAKVSNGYDSAVYNLNYSIINTTKRIPEYKKEFKSKKEIDDWEKKALSIVEEMEKIPGFEKGEWNRWARFQVKEEARFLNEEIKSSKNGLASLNGDRKIRPDSRAARSAIRTLEDNREFLNDRMMPTREGGVVDEKWIDETISKLKNGEITQSDGMNMINVLSNIVSERIRQNPSLRDATEGDVFQYQKLAKKLRRDMVSGVSKDDMDDIRREQGIMKPRAGSLNSREGLASTSDRRETDSGSSVLDSDILNFRMTGNTLSDAAEKFGVPEKDIRNSEAREMARLRESGTDKDLLSYRLNGLSLEETAKLFGTTPEKARQREAKEMERLRSEATDKDIIDYRSMGVSLEDMAKILDTTPQKIRQREIQAQKDPKNLSGLNKPDKKLTDDEITKMSEGLEKNAGSSNVSGVIDEFIDAEKYEDMPSFASDAAYKAIFDTGINPDTDSEAYKNFRKEFDKSLGQEDMYIGQIDDDNVLLYEDESVRGRGNAETARKEQQNRIAKAFNKPEVVEAFKKALAEDILKEAEDYGSLTLEEFGGDIPNANDKKKIAKKFGLDIPPSGGLRSASSEKNKERAKNETISLLAMIERPDDFAENSKFTLGKDIEYIQETLREIVDTDPELDVDRLIQRVGDALSIASNTRSQNPESRELVSRVNKQWQKLVSSGEGSWDNQPLAKYLKDVAESSDNKTPRAELSIEAVAERQNQMAGMKARGMSMDEIAREFPTLSRSQISKDIAAGEKRKPGEPLDPDKPYTMELTGDEYSILAEDLEFMGLDDLAKKFREAGRGEDNNQIRISPKELDGYMSEIEDWANVQSNKPTSLEQIAANTAGDITDVLSRLKESTDKKFTSENVEIDSGKRLRAGGSINTHEKLDFELTDAEIGILNEEINLYSRTEPNNQAIQSLKEKLSNSKNGKFSMTSDEAVEFSREMERIDKENRFIGLDLIGLIGQGADSKDGKYSSIEMRKGGLKSSSSNNFNNGAPSDINEAFQKELIFWAKRNMNLNLASKWVKKFDSNDGKMDSSDWRGLETLYNKLSPRGKRNGLRSQNDGPLSPINVGGPSMTPTGEGRELPSTRVRGLGDVGVRGEGEIDTRGRPMGDKSQVDKRFVGKKFDELKPSNWDGMDNEERQEWLLYEGSPAKSGMRQVDHDRLLKETFDEEARLEKRNKVRRSSQEPKDIEVIRGGLSSRARSERLPEDTVKNLEEIDSMMDRIGKVEGGLASRSGRTSITDEATYFRDVEDSLSKEIQKARSENNKDEVEGLTLLQNLIRRQEASKLGDRRTNAGSVFFTAEEADKIMDALMSAIDRQISINGTKRIEMYSKVIEMMAKASLSTFVDKDTAEIGARKTTRVNEAGRRVEINNPDL